MIAPIFRCSTKNGKVDIPQYEKQRIHRYISSLPNDTDLDLIIRKHKKEVSPEQRAYYFGIVVPILGEYFGYDTKEAVHEALKLKFNPVPSKIDPTQMVGGTTKNMSNMEFYGDESSFVKTILRWAYDEFDLEIPGPNEVAEL